MFIFNFYFYRTAPSMSEDIPLHWPVLHKLSNVQSQWPQNAVVLPGMLNAILIKNTINIKYYAI